MKSVFFLTQKLAGLMPEGGRMVNLSSVVSRAAFPAVLAYSMTKGVIDVMTRSLAAAFGAKGITVNAVAPGNIETDMRLSSEEVLVHLGARYSLGHAASRALLMAGVLRTDTHVW